MVYNIALSTVDSNGTIHSLYPKTKAKNVFTDKVINGRTNVEDILGDLDTRVNQKANIGSLGTAAGKNFTTGVAANNDSLVTSGGVYTALQSKANSANLGSASRKNYTNTISENSDDLVTSRAVYALFNSIQVDDIILEEAINNSSESIHYEWWYDPTNNRYIEMVGNSTYYHDTQEQCTGWQTIYSECGDLPLTYDNYALYKYIDFSAYMTESWSGSHGSSGSSVYAFDGTLVADDNSPADYTLSSLKVNGTAVPSNQLGNYWITYSAVDALLQYMPFTSNPCDGVKSYAVSMLSVDSFRAYKK